MRWTSDNPLILSSLTRAKHSRFMAGLLISRSLQGGQDTSRELAFTSEVQMIWYATRRAHGPSPLKATNIISLCVDNVRLRVMLQMTWRRSRSSPNLSLRPSTPPDQGYTAALSTLPMSSIEGVYPCIGRRIALGSLQSPPLS